MHRMGKEYLKEFSQEFFLTPGESDSEQQLPLPLLVSRLIEVSVKHANSWNAGYPTLIENNEAWVLSRVTIEMNRYPQVNEFYTIKTWIDNFNRHFSERNFAIYDNNNTEIGYARTVWVVINISTRESVDISKFDYLHNFVQQRDCPILPISRLRPFEGGRKSSYTFRFTDIDFNRHVNSCKYIELILNQWSLDFHDHHRVKRFEIAYNNEGLYGMEAVVHVDDTALDVPAEITVDNTILCRSRIIFTETE